jgi:hypothetical protein
MMDPKDIYRDKPAPLVDHIYPAAYGPPSRSESSFGGHAAGICSKCGEPYGTNDFIHRTRIDDGSTVEWGPWAHLKHLIKGEW